MTPEKQRIAIAEACGYTHVRIVKSLDGPPDHCIGHHPAQPHSIPDYLNDLNAMHEAEEVLMGEQENAYITTLCLKVQPEPKLFHATASQRAEAFLKTIGKWGQST